MKDMTDYFGRGPKGNEPHNNSKQASMTSPSDTSHEQQEEMNSTHENHSNVDSHSCNESNSNSKATSNCNQRGENTKKKKKHTSLKKISIVETIDSNSNFSAIGHDVSEKIQVNQQFNLRIKMKAKGESAEEATENINHSGNADSDNDSTASKILKSPQGTMLRYLISKTKSPSEEKSVELKQKKDITDFFSPSKPASAHIKPLHVINDFCQSKSPETSPQNLSENVKTTPEMETGVPTNKNIKLSKKKKSSTKKTKKNASKDPSAEPSALATGDNSGKQSSTKTRRKLSLKRCSSAGRLEDSAEDGRKGKNMVNDILDKDISPICLGSQENSHPSNNAIANSISFALKNILSKSPETKLSVQDEPSQISSVHKNFKKHKLSMKKKNSELSENRCDGNEVNSPGLKKKACSGNDLSKPLSECNDLKLTKALSDEPSESLLVASELDSMKGDAGSNGDSHKRNSLMKYFPKMSKEEAALSADKVEVQVKVMIHSPPVTPSKKEKRRSLKSFPDGSTALVKKKGRKIKTMLTDDLNAIDLIGVEEVKPFDVEPNAQPASTSMSSDSISRRSVRNCSVEKSDTCDKQETTPKTYKNLKRKASRRQSVSPALRINLSSKSKMDMATKDLGPNEVHTCNVSASIVDSAESPKKSSTCESSSPHQSWKMRVCLVSTTLPCARGTLHEEESESEEMHSSQKKKKRRVAKEQNLVSSEQSVCPVSSYVTKSLTVQNETSIVSDKKENLHDKGDIKIAPLFYAKSSSEPKHSTENKTLLEKKENDGSRNTKNEGTHHFKNKQDKRGAGALNIPLDQDSKNYGTSNSSEGYGVKQAPVFNKKPKSEAEDESDSEEIFPVRRKPQIEVEDKSDSEEMFPVRRKTRTRNVKNDAFKSLDESESDDEIRILNVPCEKPPQDIFSDEKLLPTKGVKIAPLFNIKARNEARQQFLLSGMPEQMKRLVETQRSFEDQECTLFPKDSHVQQKDNTGIWNLTVVELPLIPDVLFEPPFNFPKMSSGDFTACVAVKEKLEEILSKSCEGPPMRIARELPLSIVKPFLKRIRTEAPTFKVVKTYKALQRKFLDDKQSKDALLSVLTPSRPKRKSVSCRKSKDVTCTTASSLVHSQVWTEKYKPSTSTDIVGNAESVHKLTKWLEAWRQAGEEIRKQSQKDDAKRFKRRKKKDDSDDFVVDGSSDEDDSNLPDSTAILYGPTGCGKTCSVYAVARDLGYKVLEVNASEKRSGKVVLSKLSEATQSHQVQRINSAEQGFQALFSSKSKPVKRKVKEKKVIKSKKVSEEEKTEKMSLILFEDVDIVFEEEDDGFLAAVSSLISSSKRPVILTATDPESSYLNRFLSNTCLILPFSPAKDLICPWLQLVSLLEGLYVATSAVSALVSLCNGDFRKALLQMQLWVTSGGNNLPMAPLPMPEVAKYKEGIKKSLHEDTLLDDFASSVDDVDDLKKVESLVPMNTDCLGALLGRNDIIQPNPPENSESQSLLSSMEIPFPLDIGLYWWNVPRVLLLPQISHSLPSIKPATHIGKTRLLDDSFIETFCMDDEDCTDTVVDETCHIQPDEDDGVQEVQNNVNSQNRLSSKCPSEIRSNSLKNSCSLKDMQIITRQIMCISTIDVFSSCSYLPETLNNMEPVSRVSQVKDGLSLCKVDIEGPNCTLESTARALFYWLGENCLLETRSYMLPKYSDLGTSDSSLCDYSPYMPSAEEKAWRAAHATTEDQLLTAIPYSMHLERRAVSMDYIPALRTFCRLEQRRSIINTKRRNRFYHYLKSLGASLLDNELELLCQTMFIPPIGKE